MAYSVLGSVSYVLYTKQRNVDRGDIQEICNKLEAHDQCTDYHLNQLTCSQGLKWQEHDCKEGAYTDFAVSALKVQSFTSRCIKAP